MSVGVTVRKIRRSKNFSQKEIYSGIISKSYAISFEQGKHNLSLELLLEVLSGLAVTLDELLYIHQNYELDEYHSYIYRYSKYSNEHNLAALQQLLAEFSPKRAFIYTIRCAEIRCRIAVLQYLEKTGRYDPQQAPAADVLLIKDYLVSVESWTLQEVQLYGNTIELMDSESQVVFFRSLSKSAEHYLQYDSGREIYCSMLVNLISHSFRAKALDVAEVLIAQLNLLSSDYKELFHRILVQFFTGVLEVQRGQIVIENTKIYWALDVLRTLDYEPLAKELEEHLYEIVDESEQSE